jgi:DNA polymerase-3 subunit epsilon
VPLRQCSDRLSVRRAVRAACALAGIGRCGAPCDGSVSLVEYAALAGAVAAGWSGDIRPLVDPLQHKLATLSAEYRFEQAGRIRDRIATLVRACARMQRLAGVGRIAELVAARPDGNGAWEISVIRHGRLAAAGVAERGIAPWAVIEALLATADVVDPLTVALAEETECILRWLEAPGTRLVHTSEPWSMPAFGAGSLRAFLGSSGADAARAADPFADWRRLPMSSRPARVAAGRGHTTMTA